MPRYRFPSVFARWALTPLISAWVSYAEAMGHAVPRPDGQPQCHTPGSDSDRVLIVGSGPAVGWGVHSHDLALPGALARAMTARTGRGVTVDLIADRDMRFTDVIDHLAEAKLWRYDAVVVCIGVNDALHLGDPRAWKRCYADIMAFVRAASPGAVVAAAGIPPIRSIDIFDSLLGSVAATHATRLNDITEGLCARDAQACYVPLHAGTGRSRVDRHRSPGEYLRWATALGERIVLALPSGPRREGGLFVSGAAVRASGDAAPRSVAAPVVDGPGAARLQYIAQRAREAFDTESSHVTVLDSDALLHIATAGLPFPSTARADRFCSRAVLSGAATVIGDAADEDWYRGKAPSRDDDRPRFFAAFPIESATGQTIGVLSVVDSAPRRSRDVDVSLLRELALQAQRELWRDTGRGLADSA